MYISQYRCSQKTVRPTVPGSTHASHTPKHKAPISTRMCFDPTKGRGVPSPSGAAAMRRLQGLGLSRWSLWVSQKKPLAKMATGSGVLLPVWARNHCASANYCLISLRRNHGATKRMILPPPKNHDLLNHLFFVTVGLLRYFNTIFSLASKSRSRQCGAEHSQFSQALPSPSEEFVRCNARLSPEISSKIRLLQSSKPDFLKKCLRLCRGSLRRDASIFKAYGAILKFYNTLTIETLKRC